MWRRPFARLLVAAAIVAALPLPAQAQESPATTPSRVASDAAAITLRPGDEIRIVVWRQPELSGQFTILADGSIAHPLYRSVSAAGVPLSALETRLRSVIAQYVAEPHFVLEPLLRISVAGEVTRPNIYSVPPGTTIAQAVAQAGGATDDGRANEVRLRRGGQVRNLDLRSAGDAQLLVNSGDELMTPQRSQWFRSIVVPAATVLGAIASLVVVARRDD